MKKVIFSLFIIGLSQLSISETFMGADTPHCWGKPIQNENDVKCIVFFLGQFASTLNPHGGEWDVNVENRNGIWYVSPKVATELVPEGTILYKIDDATGKPYVSNAQ